jgi:hypothetical protein
MNISYVWSLLMFELLFGWSNSFSLDPSITAASGTTTSVAPTTNSDTSSNNSIGSMSMMSVRFSLYPMLHQDDESDTVSMRQVIKHAVQGLADLGLDIAADDVSSCLTTTTTTTGPSSSTVLFEAIRVALSRASKNQETGQERQINLVATFTKGVITTKNPSPPRTVPDEDQGSSSRVMVNDAYDLPPRIAAQFSLYPLGGGGGRGGGGETVDCDPLDVVTKVRATLAQPSPCWKSEKDCFCSLLDGNGTEVLDLLQSCFDLACTEWTDGPLVMSCTLTANKRMWQKQ